MKHQTNWIAFMTSQDPESILKVKAVQTTIMIGTKDEAFEPVDIEPVISGSQ